MYARSNCSVAPAAAETAGSFNGIPVAFMGLKSGRVKLVQTLLVAWPVKATTELVLKARQRFELAKRMQQEQPLKASQPAGPLQVSEDRREPVKWPGLEIAPAV